MRKSILYSLVFLSALWQAKPALSQSQVSPINTYAVVVGISGYQEPAIPKLQYADKDANLFAQWLQTRAGGNVPAYNIKALLNQDATVAALYNALNELKGKTKENDLVYIYFSGHGDVETKNKLSEGYLLAWNSPPNNYRNNAISVTDLNNTAEELTTKNKAKVILITDACHSGKMAGDYFKGRELTAANLRRVLNDQVRMASCREDELSAEGIGWGGGRGVFSYYLLKGLQGQAANNDLVQLSSLQRYIDSCFATDLELKKSNHTQQPVSDGSPIFTLAKIDSLSRAQFNTKYSAEKSVPNNPGLQSLRTLGSQPVDYFFDKAKQNDFESTLPFIGFVNETPDSIIIKMVDALIEKEKIPLAQINQSFYKDTLNWENKLELQIQAFKESKNLTESEKLNAINIKKSDTYTYQKKIQEQNIRDNNLVNQLLTLQKQLKENSYSRKRFATRFVQLVHDKSQEMLNAYMRGDLAELEKRQYYATGNRNYKNFMPLMQIAIALAPDNNYLKEILKVNEIYFDGLTDRLAITTNAAAADSLLRTASTKMQQAILLEPYSAYIRNEMGNLFFQQKKYDSALNSFRDASLLAPTWAIPHSNEIRVGLATNKLSAAIAAAKTADSLQPDLAFVNINAGLLMGKTGNLLAAESHFLRAIRANNVHYLPYEQLGDIYIRTGEYVKADSFLYEGKRRKNLFAVNESVFRFGIEAGGKPDLKDWGKLFNFCRTNVDSLFNNYDKYNELSRILSTLGWGSDSARLKMKVEAKNLLEQSPDIILADHYLGKELYFEGAYKEAASLLKNAITNYKDRETLRNFLKNEFLNVDGRSGLTIELLRQNIDSSCLLQKFLYMHYDVLEDYYLLASINEKMGSVEEALDLYAKIIKIEDQNQIDQAAVKSDYVAAKEEVDNQKQFEKYLYDHGLDQDGYEAKYTVPIFMGGSIKAAQILEKAGRFEEAEKILLAQVRQSQEAGFIRQRWMDKTEKKDNNKENLNEYWLLINERIEKETFYFYQRMVSAFPRDTYWYKNAGLFLYQRLWMTYGQVLPEERMGFYNYAKVGSYPFKVGITGLREDLAEIGMLVKTPKTYLPGTGEELLADSVSYEPVSKAKYFLQQAIRLSGDKVPDPLLMEYIAEMQSWMGLYDSAVINFQYAVDANPADVRLRSKLVANLKMAKDLPRLTQNLQVLQKSNSLLPHQKLELAGYEMLQNNYSDSKAILLTLKNNDQRKLLYTTLYMLQGDYANALNTSKSVSLDNEENRNTILYTQARIYALQKNTAQALKALSTLFEENFHLYYVLENDVVWNSLRQSKQWKKLMEKYPFNNIYTEAESDNVETVNYNVLDKRIPALPK